MMKQSMYPSADVNAACFDTALNFEPQLPHGKDARTFLAGDGRQTLPPAVCFGEAGKLYVSYYAPDAQAVTVEFYRQEYPLIKDEKGLFTAKIDSGRVGFCPLVFRVDGTEVLHPLAPVGFGGSHPINFIDIPNPNGAFYELKEVPHGAVAQNYYWSKTTQVWKSCLVYLPPQYFTQPNTRFPVLYLQHGHGENEHCWVHQGRANFIMDNLLADGMAKPFIIVMNNGMVQTVQDGVRVFDSLSIAGLLVNDCIPFIDSTYRTLSDKEHRAMAGLSMGSFQTSMVTLSHPELFSYAGVFSGLVQPLSNSAGRSDGKYLNILHDKETFEKSFKLFFRACGDTDFVALDRFLSDRALLEQLHLDPPNCKVHIEKMYHGEHEWNVWRECLRDFAQLIF